MVITKEIKLSTRGNADILDITGQAHQALEQTSLANGVLTIFTPSSTSGLTTLEYESGCVRDLQELFDQILPQNQHYAHNARWGDGNGHSHARAALLGASLSIPFVQGRLTLGTWQQIVFADFDNRARNRTLVLQFIGE